LLGLAGACLVRMSETLPEPIILTTDSDFRIYRRHSRQMAVARVEPGEIAQGLYLFVKK
jgi:hypothetical protein